MTAETDTEIESNREQLKSVHGHEKRDLDAAGEEHVLSDMDNERQAPIEHVADNVVSRYDKRRAFIREYLANAHTACVQAAKYMVRQHDDEDQVDLEDVRAVLDHSSEAYNYDPTVVVQYNRNPEASWTFRISDNGIGIPRHTAPAIRDIGLSGWHDDGTTNGQFGQGTMSGFLACGPYGEFHMTTRARENDDDYRVAWKLTTQDPLPGERGSYGTTFEWPTFVAEAEDIDVFEAVRGYAEGMIVPVIFEEYNRDGSLTIEEDFLPAYIEERYADDSPTIAYEDRFARVVWSPDRPEGWSSNIKTWCGYQPIERNDGRHGTSNKRFSMPSAFDARVKVENGCIIEVDGETDHELVGMVPISDQKYENMPDEKREGFVPRSEVPEIGMVRAPEPTDDRDRFESKHVEDFFRRYADKLEAEFKAQVGEILEEMDGFEHISSLEKDDRKVLLTGIDEYIDIYRKNEATRLAEDIEAEFGVDLGPNFAEKFGEINTKVSLAERGTSDPGLVTNRTDTKVTDVIDMAGDGDVYMGQTITQWKADVAWDLDDENQVVQVNSANYDRWKRLFGWKLLKNLPGRRSIGEELGDQLSDDVLDRITPDDGGDGPDTDDDQVDLSAFNSYDDERAKQRTVKVRRGTGRKKFSNRKGEDLFEMLNDGESFKIGWKSGFDTLVCYKQTEGHSADAGLSIANDDEGVAYAVVPNYVHDLLTRAENCYTEEEFLEERAQQTIEFHWSDSDVRIQDTFEGMDERDVLLALTEDTLDVIEEYDLDAELRSTVEDAVADEIDGVDAIAIGAPQDYPYVFDHADEFDELPTVVSVDRSVRMSRYDASIDPEELIFGSLLPDLDRSAPEWRHFFDPGLNDTDTIETLQEIQAAGGFVSTDDDAELVSNLGCVDRYDRPKDREEWYVRTCARLQEHREAQGDEDGDGS